MKTRAFTSTEILIFVAIVCLCLIIGINFSKSKPPPEAPNINVQEITHKGHDYIRLHGGCIEHAASCRCGWIDALIIGNTTRE